MIERTIYQTLDGAHHDTPDDAKRHLDRLYGAVLTSLAHQAIRVEKYAAMCDFLDSNLDAFIELKRLRDDMELT